MTAPSAPRIATDKPAWVTPAVTLGAALVGLAVVFDVAALRIGLALLSCLLLPGWGWARRFRTRDRGDTLALTVVLSLCTTVVVATTMVMTTRWSTLGGLAALVIIGAAGFVPTQRVLAGLSQALPARAVSTGRAADGAWVDWSRRSADHTAADQQQAQEEWVDWYAGARRRAAEERARARALQREADQQWAEWFRTAHPDRAARKHGPTP